MMTCFSTWVSHAIANDGQLGWEAAARVGTKSILAKTIAKGLNIAAMWDGCVVYAFRLLIASKMAISSSLVCDGLEATMGLEAGMLREGSMVPFGRSIDCIKEQCAVWQQPVSFAKKAAEGSLGYPEDYDFSWTSLHEADEAAFKKRLLEPDVDLAVDDQCHILSWVGCFCNKHGVANVRFSPCILYPGIAKKGLMELWGEVLASVPAPPEDDTAEQPKSEELEVAAVRDFAPWQLLVVQKAGAD